MHSHHSHSGQFCKHAKSSLADVLEQAHSLGFTHFHLSEHCPRPRAEELYPEEREAGMDVKALEDTFRAYVSEARRLQACLLYTSPSPRDKRQSRMPSSA